MGWAEKQFPSGNRQRFSGPFPGERRTASDRADFIKLTQASFILCLGRPSVMASRFAKGKAMSRQITKDSAYDAVAPGDFAAMIEPERYGTR